MIPVRIIPVILVFIILAACKNDTAPVDDSKEKLRLSSVRVYMRETGEFNQSHFLTGTMINYPEFYGNTAISDGGIGGTGSIKNGLLNYSIENPNALDPVSPDEFELSMIKGIYSDITISRNDANAAFLRLVPSDDSGYNLLYRELCTISPVLNSMTSISIKLTIGTVNYIYIDKDCTINAQGSKNSYPLADLPFYEYLEDFPYTLAMTTVELNANTVNLKLRKGWNTVHSTLTITLIPSDSSDIVIESITGDIKTTIDNPSTHKWVIGKMYSASEVFP